MATAKWQPLRRNKSCVRKGKNRDRVNPPGKPVYLPKQTVVIGDAILDRKKAPTVIVYVRCTAKGLRQFARFCAHKGIATLNVDGPDAWECVGGIEALEQLTGHPSVLRWHYVMSAKPDRSVNTLGRKPKIRSKRPVDRPYPAPELLEPIPIDREPVKSVKVVSHDVWGVPIKTVVTTTVAVFEL